MEDIMSNVIKEKFFSVLTGFITHLTRQLNLIAEMETTCPRIVNRWHFTERSFRGSNYIDHGYLLILKQNNQLLPHQHVSGG